MPLRPGPHQRLLCAMLGGVLAWLGAGVAGAQGEADRAGVVARYDGPASDTDEAIAVVADGAGNVIVTGASENIGNATTRRSSTRMLPPDSKGELRRILRAGDMLQSAGSGSALKTVRSFVALAAAPGSIGAARGYDANGRVNVLVTFTDRTQAVVRIQVP